jgi:hypothetical protein
MSLKFSNFIFASLLKYWSNCNPSYIFFIILFIYYLVFFIFLYISFKRLLDTQNLNEENNEMTKITKNIYFFEFF